MTITRRWQAGMETGDLSEFDSIEGNSLPTIENTIIKTGSYSIKVSPSNWVGGNVNIPDTRQIRTGFYFYIDLETQTAEKSIFVVKDASNNLLVDVRVVMPLMGADIRLYTGGTLRDTAGGALDTEAWFHIGIDINIDSSSGWVKVYKDGIEVLSYTGNTGNADMVLAHFGQQSAYINFADSYYDDLFIDDTTGESSAVVPIRTFQPIIVDGNGNYSNFDGSDGNQVDNYALVDETPPNGDTDFVQATSADVVDSYTATTYTLQANEACIALIPYASVKRTGATEQIAIGTRYSGSDSVGSDQDLPASYGYVWERQETKPGGGAWDQTAIDGVELLIKSRGTY